MHREDFQIVLVDTPGLHRPRTLPGQRLNDLVQDTYSEVDVIGLCIPADEPIGPGDRWIHEQIRTVAPNTTLMAIVTKIDKVSKERVAAQLVAVSELVGPETEIVPVSATTGEQVDVPDRRARQTAAAGTGVLSRRGAHRRARGSPDGRADPRGRPGRRPRRTAALAGRGDRGGQPAEGRDDLIDVHANLLRRTRPARRAS